MIIDGHAHVASTRFTPDAFYEGIAHNIVAAMGANNIKGDVDRVTNMLKKQNQDHQADGLIKAMDEAGIAKTVLLLPDFTWVMKSELTIYEMALEHHQIRQRHPDRFFWFLGIDPRHGEAGLEFFHKAIVDFKIDGMKLYPPCGYSPSDPMLYPFYKLCSEYKLPVLLHTGPTSPALSFQFSDPYLIDAAAMRFPDVNFILAHGGVVNVESTAQLCGYRPNVYLDISGFPSLGSTEQWQSHLKKLFDKKINHKIIFGTDWPVFQNKSSLKNLLEDLVGEVFSGVSVKDRDLVLCGNIQRLIGEKS